MRSNYLLFIMNYRDKLHNRTTGVGNAICMGMDPLLNKIPLKGNPAEVIREFYETLLEQMVKEDKFPAAVKPNIAFYEALGLDCLKVLQELIALYQKEGILVVLDAKRGDIGKTSKAYADMAFDVYGADSVTVAPYMGSDSVSPFLEAYPGKGVYVLCRTSNPSAVDFQNFDSKGVPLYLKVAEKLDEWNQGDIGAVVGATAPSELKELVAFWVARKGEIPTLIPGISVKGVSGGQGGSLTETMESIKAAGGDVYLHLINSSSGINYAYESFPELSYAEAAVKALGNTIQEFQQSV